MARSRACLAIVRRTGRTFGRGGRCTSSVTSEETPPESEVEHGSDIQRTIGFIGAGKMAEALIRGFAASGLVDTDSMSAADLSSKRRKAMGEMGVHAQKTLEPETAVGSADVVVLAVKPQDVHAILERIELQKDQLLVSVAAGLTCESLEKTLPPNSRVIRVMPNTPALVGAGATAYCLGTHATEEDGDVVQKLFSSIGCAIQVKESHMDAVTGLSGSGPAYCFLVLEAMADGGVLAGLPRETATKLAAQTMLGAAKMVLNEDEEELMHPGVLKDAVASPGGTTITGLHVLECEGVRSAFQKAVAAASRRSKELS